MSQKGSLWRKWDFHIHTPESFQWSGDRFNNIEADDDKILKTIVDKIVASDVSAFVIMDYWTFDGYVKVSEYIQKNNINLGGKVIFPGIELRIESPTSFRMNIHAILSNECAHQELNDFKAKLEVQNINKPLSRSAIIQYGRSLGDDKITLHGFKKESVKGSDDDAFKLGCMTAQITRSSLEQAFKLMGGKALAFMPWDTSDGLMKLNWKEHPADADYFMKLADIFEARKETYIKTINGIETADNKEIIKNFIHSMAANSKLAVSGSDAHKVSDYGNFPNAKATWLKCDLTFEGLKQACIEPVERSFVGDEPAKLKHYNLNPGKYIDSIKILNIDEPVSDEWFNANLELNMGLVSIVGNKGSGKSALADIMGFAANARVAEDQMSFLNTKRFKKDGGKLAKRFQAQLTLNHGKEMDPVNLGREVALSSSEFVKYIPQSYLENLCNEISESSNSAFENELKKVIYSHIPEEQRLGTHSFNDLLSKRTSILLSNLSELRSKIKNLVTEIIGQYEKSDPVFLVDLEKRLKDRNASLSELDKLKPISVKNPLTESDEGSRDFKLGKILKSLNARKSFYSAKLEDCKKKLRAISEKKQIVEVGIEKIKTDYRKLQDTIENVTKDLKEKTELGSKIQLKADLDINPLQMHLETILKEQEMIKKDLDEEVVGSFLNKNISNSLRIEKISKLVEEKAQEYNEFVLKENLWLQKKKELIGDENLFDSIENLKIRIEEAKRAKKTSEEYIAKAIEVSLEIFKEKSKWISVLEELYGSVQKFANEHDIIRSIEEVKLDFEAKLVIKNFTEDFLGYINQRSKGSFHSGEHGEERVKLYLKELGDPISESTVRKFLAIFIEALLYDVREGKTNELTGGRQLKKDKKLEDVLSLILNMEYLDVVYALKMNNRSIAELSPGEKGLLLLIFYTLLDKEDCPLIIDQPEENLDNETIKDVLVPCLKDAKSRRQVIIVTHNPNLAVVCDSEQIIYAEMNKAKGNKIQYSSGSLENKQITEFVVDVLEGTMPAFRNRDAKYQKKARL